MLCKLYDFENAIQIETEAVAFSKFYIYSMYGGEQPYSNHSEAYFW